MSIEMQKKAVQSKVNAFSDICEQALTNLSADYVNGKTMAELKEKRAFGLKKYGENSGQASFSNLINMPCLEHAAEEMVDTLNYLLMGMYQRNLLGVEGDDICVLRSMFEKAFELKDAIDHFIRCDNADQS